MPGELKTKTEANLWSEAYNSLRRDHAGSKLLSSLNERLSEQRTVRKRQIGDLETSDGREALGAFVQHRAKRLKVANPLLVQLGEKAKGLISAGASASPPAAIAVAGLFLAWDLYAAYDQEKTAMLECRDQAIRILTLRLTELDAINIQPNDHDRAVLETRALLEEQYITLFRTILSITAKLVIAFSGSRFSRAFKITLGISGWSTDLEALRNVNSDSEQSLQALFRKKNAPSPLPTMANQGRNELHEAAATGNLRQGEMYGYLQRYKIDAKTKVHQWTALMLASEQGHTTAVDVLLLYGPDVNAVNDAGRTALRIAAYEGHLDVVKALLERRRGANIDTADSPFGHTPLMVASARGHAEIVSALLASPRSSKPYINMADKQGFTALHGAANCGHGEIVRTLLTAGADPNVRDAMDRTAILNAAQRGHTDVLRFLRDGGAAMDIRSYHGWTALHFAAESDRLETV